MGIKSEELRATDGNKRAISMELVASTVRAYAFVKAAYVLSVGYIFASAISYFYAIIQEHAFAWWLFTALLTKVNLIK